MSWTDINLADVSTDIQTVPEQEFTFELLSGAKINPYDPNKIDAGAVIVEGPYAGRRIYFSYPDPAKYDWSPRVFKRLVEALAGAYSTRNDDGSTAVEFTKPENNIHDGEDPISYLNRVASAKFIAAVKHRMKEVEGAAKPIAKAEVNIFSPKPLPNAA